MEQPPADFSPADIVLVTYKLRQEELAKTFEALESTAKGGFPVEAPRCGAEWQAVLKCFTKNQGGVECQTDIGSYRACGERLERKYLADVVALKAKGV